MHLPKKQFENIRKRIPLIAVDGVLFKNSAVLMVKRATTPYKGYWVVPGGFIDFKERLEDAIVRETKEESGIDVRVRDLVGVYSDPDRDPRGRVITFCFLLEYVGGEPTPSSETSDVKFFKRLPDKISLDYRQMIRDAKKLLKNKKPRKHRFKEVIMSG